MTGTVTVVASRLAILRHLAFRLRNDPALSGVGVHTGWPGDKHVTREMLWMTDLSGDTDIAVLVGADQVQRLDDSFTMEWFCQVAGVAGPTSAAAIDGTHDRVGVLLGGIERAVADDPTLDDRVTLIDAVVSHVDSSVAVLPEGPIGAGHLTLTCTARIGA